MAYRSLEKINHEIDAIPTADSPAGGVVTVLRPVEIVNFHSMGTTPTIFAGSLALGAIAALGITLGASVRRRRRELALLKALGFTQRQLRAAIAWQATVAAVIGTVVGHTAGHRGRTRAVDTVCPKYRRRASAYRARAVDGDRRRRSCPICQSRRRNSWAIRGENLDSPGSAGRVAPTGASGFEFGLVRRTASLRSARVPSFSPATLTFSALHAVTRTFIVTASISGASLLLATLAGASATLVFRHLPGLTPHSRSREWHADPAT